MPETPTWMYWCLEKESLEPRTPQAPSSVPILCFPLPHEPKGTCQAPYELRQAESDAEARAEILVVQKGLQGQGDGFDPTGPWV